MLSIPVIVALAVVAVLAGVYLSNKKPEPSGEVSPKNENENDKVLNELEKLEKRLVRIAEQEATRQRVLALADKAKAGTLVTSP